MRDNVILIVNAPVCTYWCIAKLGLNRFGSGGTESDKNCEHLY
jgi:hypothetical protein